MDKSLKKYCSKELKKNLDNQNNTFERRVQFLKEFEKVDLRDVSLNAQKNLMCKYGCLEDMCLMATVDLNDDKQALLVQQCCNYIVGKIVLPFAVFNGDFVPFYSLEHEFEEVGKIFLIMNTICSELLEAIKN